MGAAIPRGTITIKKRLAQHQRSAPDWEYSALAGELTRWVGIFNKEWGLDLPALPHIEYRPVRNAYATYQWTRGALGLPDTITINTDALDRPSAHIIRTLGHELLHLWQQYHGVPSAQRNYHNDEYVAKAKACGILIDKHGCTAGHTEEFSRLITEHGVHIPNRQTEVNGTLIAPTGGIEPKVYGTRGAKGGGSRQKKWSCGCTNVRCAVALCAVCVQCGQPFTTGE